MEPFQTNFKFPWVSFTTLTLPVTLLLISVTLLALSSQTSSKPKLIKQGNVSELGFEIQNHPPLFYADLEYNPKTNTVILLQTGNTSGDIPQLLGNAPASSSARLNLKIETISQDNKLLHFGWMSILKETKQTPSNTYKFQITTVFKPQAKVNLYLQGKGLIWTGKI